MSVTRRIPRARRRNELPAGNYTGIPRLLPADAYNRPPMAKRSQVPPKSFEEALAELEQILSDIEGGEVPLEESLVKYERGQFLIQHCRQVLSKAEKQIEMLGKEAAEP